VAAVTAAFLEPHHDRGGRSISSWRDQLSAGAMRWNEASACTARPLLFMNVWG